MKATARQLEVLRAIASESPPPTIRELGDKLGLTSTNGVQDHLNALRARGLVEWTPLKSRGLRLTDAGQRALGRKALTDKRLAEDRKTVLCYVPQHTPPREAWGRLEADHDQARTNVRRLAARIRATVGDHDDGCNRMFSNAPGDPCCETGRLLAEVDP